MTSVLIVEDQETLSEPLAFLLRKEGFDVIIAPDGPTGLREFSQHEISIVLLDLMPVSYTHLTLPTSDLV